MINDPKPGDQLHMIASKLTKMDEGETANQIEDKDIPSKSSELCQLLKEKDRLKLQVEMAQEKLKQINHIKVSSNSIGESDNF